MLEVVENEENLARKVKTKNIDFMVAIMRTLFRDSVNRFNRLQLITKRVHSSPPFYDSLTH